MKTYNNKLFNHSSSDLYFAPFQHHKQNLLLTLLSFNFFFQHTITHQTKCLDQFHLILNITNKTMQTNVVVSSIDLIFTVDFYFTHFTADTITFNHLLAITSTIYHPFYYSFNLPSPTTSQFSSHNTKTTNSPFKLTITSTQTPTV